MSVTEVLAGQLDWACRNVVHNLDFLPDDKLNWKPAPTAKSALEIINHVARPIYGMASLLQGGKWENHFEAATNREAAKQLLIDGVAAYTAQLRALKREDLEKTAQLPFGEIPMRFAIGMPIIDLINHHGQITYLQTLLGDTESHLQM